MELSSQSIEHKSSLKRRLPSKKSLTLGAEIVIFGFDLNLLGNISPVR